MTRRVSSAAQPLLLACPLLWLPTNHTSCCQHRLVPACLTSLLTHLSAPLPPLPVGKKVRGPAPLSLALAHATVSDSDIVQLSPWTETDFRDGEQPWWA